VSQHTERLYYTDSYLKEFEARVVRSVPDPRGIRVYLDRTAFYPDSGGQPSDSGTLGEISVLDVIDEGGEVAHVLAEALSGDSATGLIDWPRRFDHMQQHTGQHILSAAFETIAKLKTASFHLGKETSTIDLDSERVGERQLESAAELANQVIFENHAIHVLFRTAAEAQQLELRKPTERDGEIRLIEIEDFDLSACGGTHVRSTGSVGIISLRKIDRAKSLTRVEFVCGARAFRRAHQNYSVLSEAGRLLSSGFEQIPELISKQSQELRDSERLTQKLIGELAAFDAIQAWQQSPDQAGMRIVKRVFDSTCDARAKLTAHAVAKQPAAVALMGVSGSPSALVFSQTPGGKANLLDIMKQTLAKFGGKGGGAKDFAQGGGVPEDSLQAALDFAETRVLAGL
jgi:alanyl-tRNA synthetase